MSINYKLHRTNTKGALTRFTTYFESIKIQNDDEINFEELQTRLNNTENLLETFNDAQFQIETKDEDYTKNEDMYFLEREEFENKYFKITSIVKKFIADKTQTSTSRTTSLSKSISHSIRSNDSISPSVHNNSPAPVQVLPVLPSSINVPTNNNTSQVNISTTKIKLPSLNLPTFNGSYEQWLFFRDTFNSLIHENASLANVQKFHYLRLSLKDAAADTIKSLEISNDNYTVAWNLLLERYENKLFLINNHVKGIFNIPTIQKESHQGLRSILDSMEKHLRALEALKMPIKHWDILIIYLITSKLDNISKRDWQKTICDSDKLPTKLDLTNFLKEKCCMLESLDSSCEESKRNTNKPFAYQHKSKSFLATSTTTCAVCKEDHNIYACPSFKKLTPSEKLNEARRLWLCINCLSSGHKTKECKSGGCRKCGKVHHTLLHFNNTSSHTATNSQNSENQSTNAILDSSESIALTINNVYNNKPMVLLSTAIVNIYDHNGIAHNCRVLLDNGSQSNFITERLSQLLHLNRRKINFSVTGINQVNSNINYETTISMKSKTNEFSCTLSCLIVPTITGNIPTVSINKNLLQIPTNLLLADPNFNIAAPVDMLIGSDIFWELLSVGQIKLGRGNPILQKTKLGWLVSGPIHLQQLHKTSTKCHLNVSRELDQQLRSFWEIEDCPKTKFLSKDDITCENHFQQTTTRDLNGRFIVSIPLKEPITKLGDSRKTATHRFMNLENKLTRSPDLKLKYDEFMREYTDLKHMNLAKDQNDNSGFFLPHHCVLKNNKLRVVFDGSSKTTSGVSLNDLMMAGPTIQDDLFSIILRFRKHNIVLGGDVVKMYRQVLIPESQRNLQKILWRYTTEENIQVYKLNTVTYGLTSSAFMAIRSLREAAIRHASEFPAASTTILQDFYVDDLLTGGNTVDELKQLKREITTILSQYGFELRKFISNEKTINCDDTDSILEIGEQNKILGLLWHANNDTLKYTIKDCSHSNKITKRQVLSNIAQIFDPLGLLAPVTITAKIILQELWKINLSWDESIPQELHTIWQGYTAQLTKLNELEIPRQALNANSISTQLHGFSDASESAYGACIYIRCQDKNGNFTTNLLCAKTRVAPLKHTTIPRLELCAALLLSELVDKVKHSINTNFDKIFYWSDSSIVLAWIRTCPSLLKVFVANRTSQIQTLSNPDSWHYVNTLENPADLLSRGTKASELLDSAIWFHGPTWLSLAEDQWPSYNTHSENSTNYSEHRTVTSLLVINNELDDFTTKFSSLKKLQRVFAYVLRFTHNLTNPTELRRTGILAPTELEDSLNTLVRILQQKHFSTDYQALQKNHRLASNSKLLNLNPFMDNRGLIRVGGRIQNSDFDYDKKHPVLLPPRQHLVTLIGREEHQRLLHTGPQALLASLREKYWPLSGRSFARKIVHNCLTCFKHNAKQQTYLMGNLPKTRLTPTRPFLITGVDYAGPYLIKDRKTRNYKTTKAYISLFVCFATKAIHLEIVSDLTTECFLAALRRFMSRRGRCAQIHSDQGTTFIGANNELQSFLRHHKEVVAEALSSDGVVWKFIPPRAPHFGGLWEAGVKSVKFHLKRVIKDSLLTYEEFSTILTQVEACVNSRPLYPLSNDPNDPNPLTPSHFLIGTTLTSLPEPSWLNANQHTLSRFQHLQQMYQHFWSRWNKEYICNLQIRSKWKENMQQLLKPGVMVVVKEDGLPPMKWRLGRILETHPGKDDIIRAVTIKTTTGIFKRPVVKICVLPNQPT